MGQPRKDSKSKRVNYDNERVSKYDRSKGKGRTNRSTKSKSSTRQDTDTGRTGKCVDGTNDVTWYANNPELLRAASSLPFSVVNGELLPLGTLPQSIPNTMTLYWNPIISGMQTDAINQAANSMYSYVVHANSRNYNYTASDLMLLIQAGASFFSMLALGIRTYGLMRLYDQRNKFMPKDWIVYSGFNFEDLKNNLSQMWFDLNQLIAMSQQIWIPNTMPMITRWFWLNSNIYMDANSAKAQYYMFAPQSYLQYDETFDQQGGCLLYKKWGYKNTRTWKDYMNVMESMLYALINSEDRGIIFGDILKAYGSERIYSISPISVDYTVTPVYNPEVLTQIENTIVWPWIPTFVDSTKPNASPAAGVFQDQVNARLYTKLAFVNEADLKNTSSTFLKDGPLTTTPILNFHQRELPSPEQIMVATRLMANGITTEIYETIPGTPTVSGFWFHPTVNGTEYISLIDISYIAKGTDGDQIFTCKPGFSQLAATVLNQSKFDGDLMAYYSFDWAPIWYMGSGKGNLITDAMIAAMKTQVTDLFTQSLPQVILCEYDNWTTLDNNTLRKMHTAAVYSEFGVPVLMN